MFLAVAVCFLYCSPPRTRVTQSVPSALVPSHHFSAFVPHGRHTRTPPANLAWPRPRPRLSRALAHSLASIRTRPHSSRRRAAREPRGSVPRYPTWRRRGGARLRCVSWVDRVNAYRSDAARRTVMARKDDNSSDGANELVAASGRPVVRAVRFRRQPTEGPAV